MPGYAAALIGLLVVAGAASADPPPGAAIDAEVATVLAQTHGKGLALAVIDGGRVTQVHAYGVRDAAGHPLTDDTVMYAASLTKTVFAYLVLQLVDEGRIRLDTPIRDDLDRPLPTYGPDPVFPDKYGPYKDLAGDPRWERITPRMCLTHSTGFHNFWFLEPDQKLRIHFEPGTRFSYSGEGFGLLQFTVEHGRAAQGLGIDIGLRAAKVFSGLGMTRTSLSWKPDFASNDADGWNDKGEPQEHSRRKKPRVAGSMDTTISDLSKFAAALLRGDGLSPASRAELDRPQLPITTAHQFPCFGPDAPEATRRRDLAAGLGVVVFDGSQGRGFYKGGHDGQTANTLVCLERGRRAVLILSNDVRTEAGFAQLVGFVLGDTGAPYDWEYGDHAGRS